MTALLFELPPNPALPVEGESAAFPVFRIFCVGRNYAAHAAEMGMSVDREAPFYFTKSARALAHSDQTIAYPPGTENYHYEAELVVAIGAPAFRIPADAAETVIFGYAAGLDMTRRDLQQVARTKQLPWDLGKDVEGSAVIGAISRAGAARALGDKRIWLTQNGTVKQDAHIADLMWSVPELISHLSGYYHLRPGDLLMTGTPAGVGPVSPGDRIEAMVEGLAPVRLTIGPAE